LVHHLLAALYVFLQKMQAMTSLDLLMTSAAAKMFSVRLPIWESDYFQETTT